MCVCCWNCYSSLVYVLFLLSLYGVCVGALLLFFVFFFFAERVVVIMMLFYFFFLGECVLLFLLFEVDVLLFVFCLLAVYVCCCSSSSSRDVSIYTCPSVSKWGSLYDTSLFRISESRVNRFQFSYSQNVILTESRYILTTTSVLFLLYPCYATDEFWVNASRANCIIY